MGRYESSVVRVFYLLGVINLTNIPVPLSFVDQVKRFESRGMKINDFTKATETLKHVSYYRLKEVARPLATSQNKQLRYDGVSFDDVVVRYYQDKNLRVYLLHSIEEIEVSLKTKVAYILGKNGPFKYLDFFFWCSRTEYCKYYLNDREREFKRNLKKKLSNSSNPELHLSENLDKNKYPSIWLAIDVLTFGDIIHLIGLMSKSNQRQLANSYNCTPNELISWLKCLKFVRNICAHNSNIIDVKLKTTPLISAEWKNQLFKYPGQSNKYTDRIAVVLCIIKFIMSQINPTYNFNKIYSPVNQIVGKKIKTAQQLGFSTTNSLKELFPYTPPKQKKYYKNTP